MARLLACLLGFAIVAGAVAFSSCTPPNEKPLPSSDTCALGCGALDAGASDGSTTVVTPDAATNDASSYNAICGTGCLPDVDGAVATCERTDAAVDADANVGTPPPPPSPRSCQLARSDHPPVAQTVCVVPGDAGEGSECQRSTDCAPGLSCVVSGIDGGKGACRSTCCTGNVACPPSTYCANIALFDPLHANDPFFVPVCTTAMTNCTLLGEGCPAGTACTIVGDKTTACVPVGSGGEGDPCPCGDGFVCQQQTSTCRKICSTSDTTGCGPGGFCASGGESFPAGYGVCITSD